MNKADRIALKAMDERELADIGISRADLPRLCAECAFGSYFYDAFVCYLPPASNARFECTPSGVTEPMPGALKGPAAASSTKGFGRRARSGSWRHHGFQRAIVRAVLTLSAMLIIWAIVYGGVPESGLF
jgi:Domain of unknown function (DUF1127)